MVYKIVIEKREGVYYIMDWENGYRKGIELALAGARRLVEYPKDVDEVLNILNSEYKRSIERQMGWRDREKERNMIEKRNFDWVRSRQVESQKQNLSRNR